VTTVTHGMPDHPDDDPVTDAVDTVAPDDAPQPSRRRLVARVVQRGLVMAVGIAIATALLAWAFDDLDLAEVMDTVRSLDDAEIIALLSGTIIMVWAESLLTASVVEGLPARRGALAWLGPNAVASLVPGPSDMPVRFRMFTSWGYDASAAGTGVAASGILNIGFKIILPVIAAVGLAVADVPLGRITSALITGFVVVGLFLAVTVGIVVSESRTRAAGRFLDAIWRRIMRLFGRRRTRVEVAEWLVIQRNQSIEVLRGRWPRAIASMMFVTVARVALLVMCVRFVGVPESAVGWEAIFCVWAIERGLTIVPIMPGNAGLSEFALVGLLTTIAGSQYVNAITAGVLIFRMLTWLLLIPIGGMALGFWRYGLRHQVDDGGPPEGDSTPRSVASPQVREGPRTL
jgi:putative heme transporter